MRRNIIDKDRIDRIFNGENSNDDEQYLRQIFCNNDTADELEAILKKQWHELFSHEYTSDKNLDPVLHMINYEINAAGTMTTRPVTRFFRWAAGIASILLILFAVYTGIDFYNKSKKFNLTWTEVKAPAWTRARFTLPDNTVVWINSRSEIKYRGDFLSSRRVILEGEAYFDVKTDRSNPFTVEADNVIITALGTKFNVTSYDDEKFLQVVLEEGELLINNRQLNKSVNVVPDGIIVYNKELDQFSSEYVQTTPYLSWKEGKLVFRNDPIDVIARRLGRWYNVDVEIKGHDFDQLRLRATFVEENLEEVLWYLEKSLPIKYKIVEGGIFSGDDFSKKKVFITLL